MLVLWFAALIAAVDGGLTDQYLQFNALLESMSDLRMLAFPCNQFGLQEPGKDANEILNCLRYVRPGNNYIPHPGITMMKKCDVNGVDEIPVYTYLKKSCGPFDSASFRNRKIFWEPIMLRDVTWNFEKFIVSPAGVPLYRVNPTVTPDEMDPLLAVLLSPVGTASAQNQRISTALKNLDDAVSLRKRGMKPKPNSITGDHGMDTENKGDNHNGNNLASKFWPCPFTIIGAAIAWHAMII